MARLVTMQRGRHDPDPGAPAAPLPKSYLKAMHAKEELLLQKALKRDFDEVWNELDPPDEDVGELAPQTLG